MENESDRRVRTVSLTKKWRRVFVPIFRQNTALIKRAFQDISPEQRRQMEKVLNRIGDAPKNWANERASARIVSLLGAVCS